MAWLSRGAATQAAAAPPPGLEGEVWTGRGREGVHRRPWRPRLAPPVAVAVGAGISVAMAVGGGVLLWRGPQGSLRPPAAPPEAGKAVVGRSAAPGSPEEQFYQVWYLLTRTAEQGPVRVRATWDTPEKQALEAQRGMRVTLLDHEHFLYFSLRLEAGDGVLRPEYVAEVPARVLLGDGGGARVHAAAGQEFLDRALIYEADRPEGGPGPIRGAEFPLAFPRSALSGKSGPLRLEVPDPRGGPAIVLAWDLPVSYPDWVAEAARPGGEPAPGRPGGRP